LTLRAFENCDQIGEVETEVQSLKNNNKFRISFT